jgi:hypothetical protein
LRFNSLPPSSDDKGARVSPESGGTSAHPQTRCRFALVGEWSDDDFDVLADGGDVGRIFKANAAPVGEPWMWTLAFGHHEDRTPTHGYATTREAAMSAFAKSWRRGVNNDDARHRSLGGVFSLMRRSKVRFRGQTGKHLLSPGFTGFDRPGAVMGGLKFRGAAISCRE